MPIPVKNPTVGTGLGLVGLLTYNVDDDSPPSSTAVFGGLTDNDSWLVGLSQSLFWSADRFRADLIAGKGVANLQFFGRDSAIDRPANPIDYSLTGWFLQPRFTVRAVDSWFVGLQATLLDASTGVQLAPWLPKLELDTTLIGLGPVVNFDTRDNRFNPRTGWLGELLALRYDDRWGSDFEYAKYKFFLNHYRPLNASTTLAMRFNGVLTDGRVPFFDQPSLTLRGFPAGRYQDEQMLATEAEARWRFTQRWTAVGILGLGKVARHVSDFGDAKSIVSKGIGIRFLASQKSRVNIGIDYAEGPDDSAVYFRVGEAF